MPDDDPISAALADAREVIDIAPYSVVIATARQLLAALGAVLAPHALTALHRHTEPCDRHRYRGIAERGACPDCRVVEWTGCETCRDEFGNPARPEDCKERAAILAALTGEGKAGG